MDEDKYYLDKKGGAISFLAYSDDLEDVKTILEEGEICIDSEKIIYSGDDDFPAIHDFTVEDTEEFRELSSAIDNLLLRYPKRRRF